jgi:hypothetical protein
MQRTGLEGGPVYVLVKTYIRVQWGLVGNCLLLSGVERTALT